MQRLPLVYAAVWLAELAALSWLYATDAPASSDPLSVALGWIGIGSMAALLVYSIARRSRALKRWARLSYWLHFHIFLACQGVLAALFHSAHVVTREAINPLNPGFLSVVGTLVIFCSGLFGRYLYGLLPRTVAGVQMQAEEVDEELKASPATPELVARRAQLERKRKTLAVTEKIFRRWIILHRPLAAMLYVVVAVHIALSYMYSSALAK